MGDNRYNEFTKNLASNGESIHKTFEPGSVKTRVYFLLLQKEQSVTDLSKFLYNKKVQLTQINEIRKDFNRLNIIYEVKPSKEELKLRGEKSEDLRKTYFKANYFPIIRYFEENIEERWGGTFSKNENIFNEEEIKTLSLILDSEWFKRILLLEYFVKETGNKVDLVTELTSSKSKRGDIRHILLDDPFRWISEDIANIGCISFAYSNSNTLSQSKTCKEINEIGNFDVFIEQQYAKLTEKQKKYVGKTLERAKELLGALDAKKQQLGFNIKLFEKEVHEYNIIMRYFAPIFIPKSLSEKLLRADRTPSTLFYFSNAINEVKI